MLVSLPMETVKCQICCYSASTRREESRDVVVPDTMPDVGTVLSTTGTAVIRGKDVSAGRVRIEAAVPVRVAYLPEEGGQPCCLETELSFYCSLEDPSIPEDSVCVSRLRLLRLQSRLLNPRKLAVEGELLVEAACYEPGELSMPGAPEDGEAGVRAKLEPVRLAVSCAVTEKTFAVLDEFELPEGEAPAALLLAESVALKCEELRTVGTKLIVRGSAETRLLYRREDGSVGGTSITTSFSQVVEPETLPEGAEVDASLLLSGVFVMLSEGDGVSGSLELHLSAQVRVTEQRTMRCLTDAYSNRYALSPTTEEKTVCASERPVTLRTTVHERLNAAQEVSEALQAWVGVGAATAEPEGLRVPVSVSWYYLTPDGSLCADRATVEARFEEALEPGQRLELRSVAPTELSLRPVEGGVELHLTLEAAALLITEQTVRVLTALEYDESAPRDPGEQPALVLLRADSGDDLWALARENCSTVEAIREANGLDAAAGEWSRLILIPRVC